MIVSFLLVRKVDPNAPFPIETAAETTGGRGKGKSAYKSKKANKDKEKGAKKGKNNTTQSTPTKDEAPIQSSEPAQAKQAPNETREESQTEKGNDAGTTGASVNPGAATDAAKPEDSKEKEKDSDTNLKEYYQPVTIRIFSSNAKVLEPLSRVVKPPDQVRKYMNEVMDRAERAPDGFLALQLPREAKDEDTEPPLSHDKDNKGGTPVLSSGIQGTQAGRNRRTSRVKGLDNEADSGVENDANVTGSGEEGEEEEEEELKDFYGPPTGLLHWGL